MPKNKPLAYSYIRFSTPEQAKGDSLRRQVEAADKWCRENGVEMDTSLTLHDKGLSAFSGANLAEGKLGAFLEAVRLGKVPKGSFLLVERVDRLSRDSVRKALRLIEEILEAGVHVVTISDGKIYTEESLDNLMELMWLLMQFSVAHEESQKKSERVGKAWQKKRDKARSEKTALSQRCPKWLNREGDNYTIIPERAAVVREIFDRCIAEKGSSSTAKALNDRGEPVWGVGKKSNGKSKYWHASYITKILTEQAAIGVYRPHKMVNGKRVPDGEPIYDYYPRVVSDQVYYAAQAKRRENKLSPPGRAPHRVSNLFTGLLKCRSNEHDHGGKAISWHFKNSEGAKNPSKAGLGRYICCAAFTAGDCSVNLRWPYAEFERIFLEFITQIDLSDAFEEADDSRILELRTHRDGLKGKIEGDKRKAERLLAAIASSEEDVDTLVSLRDKLLRGSREMKDELGAVVAEIRRSETNSAQKQADIENLRSLAADLRNEDSRFRLRSQLKERIAEISIMAKDRPQGIDIGTLKTAERAAYHLQWVERFVVCFHSGERRIVELYPVEPNKYLRSKAGQVRAQRWGHFKVFDFTADGIEREIGADWDELLESQKQADQAEIDATGELYDPPMDEDSLQQKDQTS